MTSSPRTKAAARLAAQREPCIISRGNKNNFLYKQSSPRKRNRKNCALGCHYLKPTKETLKITEKKKRKEKNKRFKKYWREIPLSKQI